MKNLRALIVVLVLVALVAGGFYYADTRIRQRVEQQVAAQLQSELGTPGPPEVDIPGFPFLTRVAVGSIKSVHVLGDQLGSANDAPLIVEHVDLTLTDVTSDDRFQTMTAGHAEGNARLSYAALSSIAGVPLTYVGDGRVRTEVATTVLGQEVKAKVEGTPGLDVDAQAITLEQAKVTVGGVTLPEFTSKPLLRGLLKPMTLTGIPFGLKVTGVDAEDDGVHTDLAGDELPIR